MVSRLCQFTLLIGSFKTLTSGPKLGYYDLLNLLAPSFALASRQQLLFYRKFHVTMASLDSDEEVCILYNHKEEQSRKAIEIVIDDEDVLEVPKHNASSAHTNTSHSQMLHQATSSSNGTTDRDVFAQNSSSAFSLTSREHFDNHAPSTSMNNSSHSSGFINPREVETRRAQIEQFRNWNYTNLGCAMIDEQRINLPHQLVFSVMSYNVLSQQLLEDHPYLYTYHDTRALSWEHRSQVLLKEFALANADILCLQEVQKSHLDSFYNRLHDLGYTGIYKQRTGGKVDGVAIYYKKSMFTLQEESSVEFYQPGISVLNRDNVALIAKLAFNKCPRKQLIVATTHLLFNPKRHDVKLAQVQLLLAEVERFAYIGEERSGAPIYCPSVVTGDMNFEPFTGPYQLITTGMLKYEGLSSHTLKNVDDGRQLSKSLVPSDLEVTDTCQHYSLLLKRPTVTSVIEQNISIKLYHSNFNKFGSFKEYVNIMKSEGYVNNFAPRPHTSRETDKMPAETLPPQGFGTGQLSHHLNLRSVYKHGRTDTDGAEITTLQKQWTTVDYIFYSGKYSNNWDKIIEGDLKLLGRLQLPKRIHAKQFGSIPNLGAPSDHFPLVSLFILL